MRLLLRRYLLPGIIAIALYTIVFFLFGSQAQFINLGLINTLVFAYLIRLEDDYFDYEKDQLNNKVTFSKDVLLVLAVSLACFNLFLILSAQAYWMLLPFVVLILQMTNKKALELTKVLYMPFLTFGLVLSYFKISYHLIWLVFILVVLDALLLIEKKELTILISQESSVSLVGGKGYNLLKLKIRNTPKTLVVPASYFEDMKENPGLEDKLQKDLTNCLHKNKKYAVRSSAIDEDSSSYSFAGVHESYLNINKNEVMIYIQKVYQSAFTPLAIEYRKLHNLDLENIKMAVVIQEMVDSEFAGVINTINPVTSNPDEIILSVRKGLGDKLVDGTNSGSTYTINSDNVTVVGEDILSRKIIKKILKMVNEVVSKTLHFQDIEFAYAHNKVYFLQTRDIVNYAHINVHHRHLIIDNSNIIESYFGNTSLLTYTFANDVYKEVYTATLKLGKVNKKILSLLAPSLEQMLCFYDDKIYYNLNNWYRVTSIFPFKKSLSYMENMMGVKSKTNAYKRIKMNLFGLVKSGLIFINKLHKLDELIVNFENNFERIVMPYYGKELHDSTDNLINLFNVIQKDVVKEFAIPIINDSAVMIYFGRLKEKAKKQGLTDNEINRLISNNGQVKSIGSALELVKIVAEIKKYPAVYQDFKVMDELALFNKYTKETEIGKMIHEYIYDYGSRVMDELKLETITMIEKPLLAYTLIKNNLETSYDIQKEEEIKPPKKLEKLSNKAKKYIQNRERLRLKRTYVYSVVRNIFLGIAQNFVDEGKIDEINDIFYLSKNEVFENRSEYRSLILQRKEKPVAQEEKYYNRVSFFDDVALGVDSVTYTSGLKGIPSGYGVIQGRVRLMTSQNDYLPKGDIILAKRTDPGWISLFPLAGGLIVEHGSMLSHSFVVARELKLPAVVGVENATQVIKDQNTVILDGLKGVIEIVE